MTVDLGLLVLAAFFALRAAYYREQPAWKWLLPIAVVSAAALPDDAPQDLVSVIVGLLLVGAVAHIRWVGRRLPGRHEQT